MAYHILNADNLPQYLYDKGLVNHIDSIGEIGNGNLNYVFLINADGQQLILKQAVPFLRIAGEGWPLSENRMKFEIMALELFGNVTPDYVPRTYLADPAMSTVVMEYLDNYTILREWMINSKEIGFFAPLITRYLVDSLFATSVFNTLSEERQQIATRFSDNIELCKLTEEFVFTFPFMVHHSNNFNPWLKAEHQAIIHDSVYKNAMLELKYLFTTKKEAVIHGDLHTGSIMTDGSHVKVIDAEFAFYGPIAFDPGKLIGNLFMSAIAHRTIGSSAEYIESIHMAARQILTGFLDGFKAKILACPNDGLIYTEYKQGVDSTFVDMYMQRLFQEIVGFAGAAIGRRMFGIAGVADIRGLPDTQRELAEKRALRLSKELVKNYSRIQNIEDLFTLVHTNLQGDL